MLSGPAFTALPAPVNALGLIVAFPPATGFKAWIDQELEEYSTLGFQVLKARPPYLRGEFSDLPRGLHHPAGERRIWELCIEELRQWLAAQPKPPGPRLLLGLNLGGSIAAFAASALGFDGLVVAGSVPRLSRFWVESAHPVAVRSRSKGAFDAKEFQETMSGLDLVSTLSKTTRPCLVQFGEKDEWIEIPDIERMNEIASRSRDIQIEWTEDDHEMGSERSRASRKEFIGKWSRDRRAFDSERLLESAIDSNLRMSHEGRIEAHENAWRLMDDLRRAGEEAREKPQNSS